MTAIGQLREKGLTAGWPYVRPNVTPIHRQKRLQWAKQHVKWARLQWNAVLFRDESRLNLFFAGGRMRIRLRCGERFAGCCIHLHNWFVGWRIHIWGRYSFHHRLPPHIFRGNLNAETYRDEVLSALVAPAFTNHQILNISFRITQLSTPYALRSSIYSSRTLWRSIDLPYHQTLALWNTWDELGRRVYMQNSPVNLQQLEADLSRERDLIARDFLQWLVRSMGSRFRLVCKHTEVKPDTEDSLKNLSYWVHVFFLACKRLQ